MTRADNLPGARTLHRITGIPLGSCGHYLDGRREPPHARVVQIAEATGIPWPDVAEELHRRREDYRARKEAP